MQELQSVPDVEQVLRRSRQLSRYGRPYEQSVCVGLPDTRVQRGGLFRPRRARLKLQLPRDRVAEQQDTRCCWQ